MAQYRELPSTQVGFWVVERCPFCGKTHFHPAGREPLTRLGLQPSPCGHEYLLQRQEKRKKSKKARRRNWEDWDVEG